MKLGTDIVFGMPPTGIKQVDGVLLREAPLNAPGSWFVVEYGKRVKKTVIVNATRIKERVNENNS